MDQNAEFLNYIYQNAEMGVNTLTQLIKEVDAQSFKEQLKSQLKEYQQIKDEATNQIHQNDHVEKGIPKTAVVSTYLTIAMKTILNQTPEHISEMLIQGSTMGIIDVSKKIKHYPEASVEIKALANKILKTEQSNIDQLKNFL